MQAVKRTQCRLDFRSLEIVEVEDSGKQESAAVTFRSVLPCAFSKISGKGTQGCRALIYSYRFVHHSGAAAALLRHPCTAQITGPFGLLHGKWVGS